MTDLNQVKVDNWGVYFLQRLKHFFNRTDYCDLTLQFQDNAQLKVHRLVLSACTEYFELLERTCEKYEDCLVMPDDLQADVVVPIINFMYTGHLEFEVDLLEKLFQTSQIMNMPVLSKLLDAQRKQYTPCRPVFSNSPVKRYSKVDINQRKVQTIQRDKPSTSNTIKRSYEKAFEPIDVQYSPHISMKNKEPAKPVESQNTSKKFTEPRPTRYELPEELDTENIFDNSFSNISYTTKPLVVHPETIKRYGTKKNNIFLDQKFRSGSTIDIVECKKITNHDDDVNISSISDDTDIFGNVSYRNVNSKDSSQLFDQILDNTAELEEVPKVTVETQNKHNKLDHAKIISEVLKKYPHLMKSNKNIKLKILNTSNKIKKSKPELKEEVQTKIDSPGFTYESEVLNSKEAAKLIALGAENIKGPWICLICGTPGRALHFTSYYKFRRHLIVVHNEKPILNMCEYCGLKSNKRNCLLHHLYTQHNVKPPPQYHFPKCNMCSYIALTQGLLVKHKLSHSENQVFRCVACSACFSNSIKLLDHIRKTGHKFTSNRNKSNVQCIYCMKMFLKESNLYAHLKVNHKMKALKDGIIDESDEEISDIKLEKSPKKLNLTKFEMPLTYEPQFDDVETQYEIEEKSGKIQIVSKRHVSTPKQKILNPGFRTNLQKTTKDRTSQNSANVQNEFLEEYNVQSSDEEIVMINDNEYTVKGNQLIERKRVHKNDYNITEIIEPNTDQALDPTCMQYTHIYDTNPEEKSKTTFKEQNAEQSIQFVVSGNEDYKTLMSSNQSVIFGDNEDTKTLTVLTAPHATSTMDASTIDLDNTQSNEMMIVPDGYPLNVSEAVVSADNSNIVVVYSHPIDNQNKQYQFITTQNLGAQFVQTSAVLTPTNFESTPIVTNNQVINVPMDNTWQNNIQETIENAQIEITLTPVENIDELPNVQLKQPQTVIVRNPNEEILNQQTDSSGNVTEVIEQPITQESVDSATLIDANASSEVVVENISNISEASDTNVINKNQEPDKIIQCTNNELQDTTRQEHEKDMVPKLVFEDTEEFVEQNETIIENNETVTENNETIIENNETIIENNETIIENNETIIENNETIIESNETIIENSETITEINETVIESNENNENVATEEHKENDDTTIDGVVNETVISEEIVIGEITKEAPKHNENENISVVKEKIQNLASEWSEDEVEEEDITHESEKQTSMEIEEIEESVENIQQEVQRHVNQNLQNKKEIVNSNKDALSLKNQEGTSPKEITTKKPVSLEKISSLLNDWDENDSQEACPEASSKDDAGETKIPEPVETIKKDSTREGELQMDTTLCQKDNIKILVSDWDDDEENKETEEEK